MAYTITANEIWIKPRPVGESGDGTINNPYNASGSLLKDIIQTDILPNTTVHLYPGDYVAYVEKGGLASRGIHITKNGTRLLGAGQGSTRIKLIFTGWTTNEFAAKAEVFRVYDMHVDFCEVADMTLDCNGEDPSIGADAAVSGIFISGSNNIIQRVEVIKAFGGTVGGHESFPICIGDNGYSHVGLFHGNIIRDCLVKDFAVDCTYANGVCLFGTAGGLISNNIVWGAPFCGYQMNGTGGTLDGNFYDGPSNFYGMDTGPLEDISIVNNTMKCGSNAIGLVPARDTHFHHLRIQSNSIILTENNTSGLLIANSAPPDVPPGSNPPGTVDHVIFTDNTIVGSATGTGQYQVKSAHPNHGLIAGDNDSTLPLFSGVIADDEIATFGDTERKRVIAFTPSSTGWYRLVYQAAEGYISGKVRISTDAIGSAAGAHLMETEVYFGGQSDSNVAQLTRIGGDNQSTRQVTKARLSFDASLNAAAFDIYVGTANVPILCEFFGHALNRATTWNTAPQAAASPLPTRSYELEFDSSAVQSTDDVRTQGNIVSYKTLSTTSTGPGWYRVAAFNPYSLGSITLPISVSNPPDWSLLCGASFVITTTGLHTGGKPSLSVISGTNGSWAGKAISSARLVGNTTGEAYLDLYLTIPSASNITVMIGAFAGSAWIYPSLTPISSTTGYTTFAYPVPNGGGSSMGGRLLVNSPTDDSVSELQVAGTAKANHLAGGSSTPAWARGAGAGTTGTGSVDGNDLAGKITVNTSSGTTASSIVATVTFATAFASAPHVILTPHNGEAAQLSRDQWVWAEGESTTKFDLKVGSNSLTGNKTYEWNYLVCQ